MPDLGGFWELCAYYAPRGTGQHAHPNPEHTLKSGSTTLGVLS